MTDNKGRKVKAVYPITWDSAYCLYDVDESGDFVYTSYTYAGKFTKIGKNRIEYAKDGGAFIRKDRHILWLRDFCLTDWNPI